MDHTTDNPAGRLHLFLSAVAAKRSQQIQVLTVVAEHLGGIEAKHSAELYRGIAEILALPDLIEAGIDDLVAPIIPKTTLLRPIPSSRQALTYLASLTQSTEAMMQQLSASAISELEMVSHILSPVTPEPVCDADTLREIDELATEIIGLLASSNLDDDLKALLLSYVQGISSAVRSVSVRGFVAVLDERDRMVGMLQRIPDARGAVAGDPTLRGRFGLLFQKIQSVVFRVGPFVALAADTATITQAILPRP